MESLSFISALELSLGAVALLAIVAVLFSSYIKIVTVLSIVRAGLGMQSLPSAFVTAGLAIALSFFVMAPTLFRSSEKIDTVLRSKDSLSVSEKKAAALEAGMQEWKQFLIRHTHAEEKAKFAKIAEQFSEGRSENSPEKKAAASKDTSTEETESREGTEVVEKQEPSTQPSLEESWRVLAPAFLVSELKEAFKTGLTLFLPFLVVELVVANILVALGHTRLGPEYVSLPFKLLLFVMLDGWTLITTNLVTTYLQ